MDNKQNIVADKGVFNFSDDPGGLLFLYRLFEEVVLSIRSNNAESITHAQNNIIKALCTLSNKIGDTTEDTTIRQALQKWAIPLL